MNEQFTSQSGLLSRRALTLPLVCAAFACSMIGGTLLAFFGAQVPAKVSPRTLTFAERVAYQRAIEDVYWRHRIWPKERHDPKPSLDAVMSHAQIEKKVEDYLSTSQALDGYWGQPLTPEQLQAEMDRMARDTKQPEVLRELFDALGNDPFVIAECLARPVLSERLITSVAQEQRQGRLALSEVGANSQTRKIVLADANYVLPTISDATTGLHSQYLDSHKHDKRPRWPELSHGGLDWHRNDCLGRRDHERFSLQRRQIQSQHGQLDGHQHHKRAE
jgi:hypothetical protein